MASFKLVLYKSKTYKDGRHPIALRIYHNKKKHLITLGVMALDTEWNSDLQRLNSTAKNFKQSNKLLEIYDSKAEEVSTEIIKEGKQFTFELFKSKFLGEQKTSTLYKLYEDIILERKSANKISTANIYQNSLNVLKKFRKKDRSLYEVDYTFLKNYETFLFKNKNSGGGVHHHMRTLRAVINEAINRKYLEESYYPFSNQFKKDGYSLSHLKSNASPRALSESDMEKIKSFNIEEYPALELAHDYFMFSYYARGINFVDLARLKWTDFYDGRLIYNRSKTNKLLNLKVSKAMQTIIDKYNKNRDYVFPVLSEFHITEAQIKNRVKKCLKKFNGDLKEISKLLKLDIHLTSYVARHTYATTLKRKGISTEIISEALGHGELSTTKAYLKKFSNEYLDDADTVL